MHQFTKPICVRIGKHMRLMRSLMKSDFTQFSAPGTNQYDTLSTTHDPRRMWQYDVENNHLYLCSRPYECVYMLTEDDIHSLRIIKSVEARIAFLESLIT